MDTNVLVSALLSPHGAPGQVLRLLLQGDLVPLHDDRILAEYRAVLSRPRFAFAPEDVAAVLAGIEGGGEMVFAKPLPLELPDPDDLPFLEVSAAGRAHGVEILSPRELLERLSRP
ncbi:MAG: PIN domain-containing protein [Gemmatimonadota bacterium]